MRHLTNEPNPKPIQLVLQRELDDCAVACIAMVTGLPYEAVIKETGKPEFLKYLKDERTLKVRQSEMNDKLNRFLLNRGFVPMAVPNPTAVIPGRRYVANVIIRHPQTNEPSALEHNVVIDEFGKVFDPSGEKKQVRVSGLREIIFVGE